MSNQQNSDFLEYMYERFKEAKLEEAESIIKYLDDLGFEDDARSLKEELVESIKASHEDWQMKQDLIQN